MSKYKSIRSATDPTPEGIEKGVISVSRLNELAKDTLEKHFGNISVEGEISNLVCRPELKEGTFEVYTHIQVAYRLYLCVFF